MHKTTFVILFCIILLNCFSNVITERTGKFFPWPIGFVRFQNSICSSLEGYEGACYTRRQCTVGMNGTSSGTCANRIGTCCIFQRGCGSTSAYNNTYFVNTGFPNSINAATQCVFTIQRCNSDICQLRLDFLALTLAQPDGNGNCVFDSLVVTGGASTLPVICGENSGEHMYVNFNGDADIKVTISTSAAMALGRAWNIKATQIGCDCPTLAPTGCLMYYTALTGTVQSFNYGTTLNGNLITINDTMNPLRPGTREMVNLNYGVCVRMEPGYCSIEWSQGPDDTSFTVSGNTAFTEVIPGLPGNGLLGENCTTDFVVIPNPYFPNGMPVNADRFCGNQFPTVITSAKTFVLTVVTNNREDADLDIANRGFSLNYRQLPCATNLITA